MAALPRPTPSATARCSDADRAAFAARKEAEYRAELAAEVRRKRMGQAERALRESGLDRQLSAMTFASFRAGEPWQEGMRRTAEDWARNPSGWLLLSGQSGCGKTHLCTAAAGELLRRGVPVRYMLWRQDSRRLKPNAGDAGEAERALAAFKRAECLYVDDLFKGGATEADVKLAFELLDERYRADRPTILSTELTPNQLMRVDEAVAGRIFEKCQGHRVCIRPDAAKNLRLAGRD